MSQSKRVPIRRALLLKSKCPMSSWPGAGQQHFSGVGSLLLPTLLANSFARWYSGRQRSTAGAGTPAKFSCDSFDDLAILCLTGIGPLPSEKRQRLKQTIGPRSCLGFGLDAWKSHQCRRRHQETAHTAKDCLDTCILYRQKHRARYLSQLLTYLVSQWTRGTRINLGRLSVSIVPPCPTPDDPSVVSERST